MNFTDRIEFTKYLNELAPNGIGIEVGSYSGEYAKIILTNWNGTLYMIDVWHHSGGISNPEEIISKAIRTISGFEDRTVMIRTTSRVASHLFKNESVDFIYIDANHEYDKVTEDLYLWFPKLKNGGVFSGHDYLQLDWYNDPNFCPNGKDKYIWVGENYSGVYGVNPAVDEFCNHNSYSVNLTGEWCASWWFIK